MSTKACHEALRTLPQVEEVLRMPRIKELADTLPDTIVTDCVRDAIAAMRADILAGRLSEAGIDPVAAAVQARVSKLRRPSLRRVVNVSGIVIHTNLGRSLLSQDAIDAVARIAGGYSTLEYDTDALARGSRHDHYEQVICALTGAEAALAVNNNAAAVMMVLSEFSDGCEAVVSRGEMVEIGGSFRIPDIMRLSNAEMVEVGTTNKTRIRDYREALSARTALLLKVHPSNYRMVGFTEAVPARDLRRLADEENDRRQHHNDEGDKGKVLVYEDLGSGAFVRLACFGEHDEPTVQDSLGQGCDLVSFSGDKLLGGPQAGIIVGSRPLIDRLKASPWARVLRLDKLTLAALEATLHHYLDAETVCEKIPTLRMLNEPASAIKGRAEQLKAVLGQRLPEGCTGLSVVEEVAYVGGGALPMCDLPSFAVCIEFQKGSAQDCERYLAVGREVPVIPRIKKGMLLCDVRTLTGDEEVAEVASALEEYFGRLDGRPGPKGHPDGA